MKYLKEVPFSESIGAGALAAFAFRVSTGIRNPIVVGTIFAAGVAASVWGERDEKSSNRS